MVLPVCSVASVAFGLFVTIAHQAPLSLGFSRQDYWSELPCPPPRDLPDQESNPCLLHCRRILYHWANREAPIPPKFFNFHHGLYFILPLWAPYFRSSLNYSLSFWMISPSGYSLSRALDRVPKVQLGSPTAFIHHQHSPAATTSHQDNGNTLNPLLLFSSCFRFFWCEPFLKPLLNLLRYCFCFIFWFVGPEACGILAP